MTRTLKIAAVALTGISLRRPSATLARIWSLGANSGVTAPQALNVWLIQIIVAVGPPLGAEGPRLQPLAVEGAARGRPVFVGRAAAASREKTSPSAERRAATLRSSSPR